mgnify:CR=1 FL=1
MYPHSDLYSHIVGQTDYDNYGISGVEKYYDNYLGDTKNIRDLLLKSNIVVLPSFYGEGLPKILIEAAACGLPVITTNHPGCRDAVKNRISGDQSDGMSFTEFSYQLVTVVP